MCDWIKKDRKSDQINREYVCVCVCKFLVTKLIDDRVFFSPERIPHNGIN